MVTLMPRDSSIAPKLAAAMPLPREETTPPVTNTYLVIKLTLQKTVYKAVYNYLDGNKFYRKGSTITINQKASVQKFSPPLSRRIRNR
jgi:hypothetical protein